MKNRRKISTCCLSTYHQVGFHENEATADAESASGSEKMGILSTATVESKVPVLLLTPSRRLLLENNVFFFNYHQVTEALEHTSVDSA